MNNELKKMTSTSKKRKEKMKERTTKKKKRNNDDDIVEEVEFSCAANGHMRPSDLGTVPAVMFDPVLFGQSAERPPDLASYQKFLNKKKIVSNSATLLEAEYDGRDVGEGNESNGFTREESTQSLARPIATKVEKKATAREMDVLREQVQEAYRKLREKRKLGRDYSKY